MALSTECWWQILHKGHHAWYQRSLLAGDFRPGLAPRADYIVDEDGRWADPMTPPSCATCHELPDVNDLVPVERATGNSHFLVECRAGRRAWPRPTSDTTCWACNSPFGTNPRAGDLCSSCARHMSVERKR